MSRPDPSSAVPGPQGERGSVERPSHPVPSEAEEAAALALAQWDHEGRVYPADRKRARAVIEAALPFLSPAKERLPAVPSEEALKAAAMAIEQVDEQAFEDSGKAVYAAGEGEQARAALSAAYAVDSSPSPDRGADYLRGVMSRAAEKLEAMPPHLDPVHVAQCLRAAVDASLVSGTPKGLELRPAEIQALIWAASRDFDGDRRRLRSAESKLRAELARRSGSPEGGTR